MNNFVQEDTNRWFLTLWDKILTVKIEAILKTFTAIERIVQWLINNGNW